MKLGACLLALFFCYAVFLAAIYLSYGNLPVRLATHFDLAGRPNGWMSRAGFVEFMVIFGTVVPAFVVGSMAISGRIPVSFVNLPHRDYWLAPERRGATSAILLRYALVLACLLLLFFTGLYELTVQASAPGSTGQLNNVRFFGLTGLLLAATAGWSVALIRHFSLAPK